MLSLQPIVLLLVAVSGVNAGNRAWEPPIHYAKAAIAARDLSGVNNIYANGTNVSSGYHAHEKRFFGIGTPANSGTFPRLWPDGNINACFEQRSHQHQGQTKHTRDILYNDLITARELWRSAGLDDKNGKFQFTILGDDDPRCDRDQRSNHLLIMYAGEGRRRMTTSVGVVRPQGEPQDNNIPDADLGSTMILTDILDIGMQNVVANYAHEMGHAWGLHHEHQNPKWWDGAFTRVDRQQIYFSETNFKCENLADFDDQMAPYDNRPDLEEQRKTFRNEICRDRSSAGRRGFAGGYNYIPITEETGTVDDEKDEPDWFSIMLYPSNAGGKTVGGVKQNVITRMNGDIISPNSKPSWRDVQGLKKIYGVKTPVIVKFLGDTGNSLRNVFDKIRKKDKDSGCSTSS